MQIQIKKICKKLTCNLTMEIKVIADTVNVRKITAETPAPFVQVSNLFLADFIINSYQYTMEIFVAKFYSILNVFSTHTYYYIHIYLVVYK